MAASAVGGGCSLFGKGLEARMKTNDQKKNKIIRTRVMCVSSSSPYSKTSNLTEQYKTLRIQPGSSEMEVKKAFRQLALQYHPDVCNGKNSGDHFSKINEAYDIVMNSLRASPEEEKGGVVVGGGGEEVGLYDDSVYDDSNWELWEL